MAKYDKNALRYVTAVIALVTVLFSLLLLSGCSRRKTEPTGDIPTPSQMLYNMDFEKSVAFDINKLETEILSDSRFFDYQLKDEYTMVYLIDGEESEARYRSVLGITEELPAVDYSERNIIISVGRKISDIVDKKRTDDEGNKLNTFVYGEEYHSGTAFVYSIKKIDFLSGFELERYLLEKLDDACNLVEGERSRSVLVAQGEYNKVYLKNDIYEYLLFTKDDQSVYYRRFTDTLPEITEHSETMVQVADGGKQFFYNPRDEKMTSSTDNKLFYVNNTIVAYARTYNGEIVLCVRDAYDTSKYNYVYAVPFTQNESIKNELIVSLVYVDSFTLQIEFYGGAGKTLQTMDVKVVNMEY